MEADDPALMFFSHLAATVLACMLLQRLLPSFGAKAWMLAIAFGVLIDLDHALMIPSYFAAHGGLFGGEASIATALAWGNNWQGFMHTPWALLVVAGACLLFLSWIPLAFWGFHMVLDFYVALRLVTFGGALEWTALAVMVTAIAALAAWDHRGAGSAAGPFHAYVRNRILGAVTAGATVVSLRGRA